MTMTGLKTVDETVHTTNTWLHEITSRLGWEDRQRGYRLLRVGLHAIRDALPLGGVAHLSAQLPLLVRGVFFEGWQPTRDVKTPRTIPDFLADISDAFSDDPTFDAETAFRELINVMKMHVSRGQMDNVRAAMPEAVKELWAD